MKWCLKKIQNEILIKKKQNNCKKEEEFNCKEIYKEN